MDEKMKKVETYYRPRCIYCGKAGWRPVLGEGSAPPRRMPRINGPCINSINRVHGAQWEKC